MRCLALGTAQPGGCAQRPAAPPGRARREPGLREHTPAVSPALSAPARARPEPIAPVRVTSVGAR